MLTSLIVVITSQYMRVSYHTTLHTLTFMSYVNSISVKLGEKKQIEHMDCFFKKSDQNLSLINDKLPFLYNLSQNKLF